MRFELARIVRYFVVGALTAVVYFSSVAAFIGIFDLRPIIASILAQMITTGVAYYGHALFSFQVEPNASYLRRFVFITGTSLVLNIAVMWVLEQLGVPYRGAIAVVAVAIPLYTYACNRLWVFFPGLQENSKSRNPAYSSGASSLKSKGGE